jgi:large subunit ribosomal protein L3
MEKFILGKKLEISQIFNEKGEVIPVTLIEAGPVFITQIKTKEKDGYEAVQVGLDKIEKKKKLTKTKIKKPYYFLREFRIKNPEKYKLGEKIDVSIFKEGEFVKVSGVSKGKGFQGVIKRHGFARRGASHGVKHEERTLGSVGASFPQRVWKGKKMPGRMGGERVTVRNLEVIKVEPEKNILAVKGAVPGKRGGLVQIRG